MASPAPVLSDVATVVCIAFILLVPFAIAGIALINVGLGRSRSAAHMMTCSLGVIAVAALVYFIVGFSWQGYAGGPAYYFLIGGKQWNWIATERLFLRSVPLSGAPPSIGSLAAWFGLFSVSLAAIIPLGSGADRWRMSAAMLSTAVLAGWTYPLFAHWVWAGGWLSQLGMNYQMGQGFVDVGGASTIHCVAGLTGLSVAWILGPRRGKYTRDGLPTAIPGHNSVYMMFGCLLALVGWIGMNGAGAILFAGVDPSGVVLIGVNTLLCAVSAGLTAAIVTKVRFRKPDASLSVNGWVGGLVASSATCAFIKPPEAVVVGAIAGGLVTLTIEWFELKLGVDDPGGAVSAHALGGLWGLLALGIWGDVAGAGGSNQGQLLAQIVGIATLLGFVFPLTYGLNWALNRVHAYRVEREGERQGMDLYELGAGAYPEFVTHNDETSQRGY
jgi:Amt family ammonium transporter